MKTLTELLQDADPLGYEPRRTTEDRARSRELVLRWSGEVVELRQRWITKFAVATLVLTAIATGAQYWSRAVPDIVAAVRFEVRLAEESPAPGLQQTVIAGTGQAIYLHRESILTNSDIARAQVAQGDTASTFNVSIELTSQGAAKIFRATQSHMGRPLAILLDGEVVMAPTVRGPITTSAMITGNFSRTEAERITIGMLGR